MGRALDGDLPFGHGLQECGLGFGGGAVDFVGQQQTGEDGAGLKVEAAGDGIEDRGAGDIGGQQIWCALQSTKTQSECLGEGPGRQGLAQPRHILK